MIVPPKPASRVISTIPITTRETRSPAGTAGRACACGHAGGTEPRDVGPRGGGRGSFVAECGPIKCRGRRRRIEQRAFGCRPCSLANANSTAEVTPPVLGGGYAVQVTSERSESRAQAAFRVLQAKYPNQLGGRQPIIRRADLGAAGTYYRALVGPLDRQKKQRLCSGLKAAGADCIIQKN